MGKLESRSSMRLELGGTGTPFGYTDPDLYEFELDEAYSATLESGEEPSEAGTVLIALQMNADVPVEDES